MSRKEEKDLAKLIIGLCNGDTVHIMGSHEVMGEPIEAWENWIKAGEPREQRVVRIDGYHDSADRSELKLVVDLDKVNFMNLVSY